MSKNFREQAILRSYILGDLGDDELPTLEERLMTDEEYFQELVMTEEDLIQEYVDERLGPAEREKFEKRVLISEANRSNVKFERAFRKYAAENTPKKPNFFESLKAFFLSPIPAACTILIILAISGLFIWKSLSDRSEVLTALNKAYRTERPVESRITDFEYAPAKNTRGGNETEKTDKIALDIARYSALKAVDENPSAENLHALGRVYLAEKEFDKAIEQFEKAVKSAPNNAKLHSDLGVALMENSQLQDEGELENLGKSLKEFEKAIELDPTLLEAVFNKARCLELIPLPNQAKEAWQEYLKIDPSSPWSKEARQHLEKLDSNAVKELTASEFEKEFLKLYRERDDEKAWQLISENRELVKEKYLPQRLAMSFVDSPTQEREENLQALKYLGGLEKERIGDLFASDLADFYTNLSNEKIELLKKAQILVREGYRLCQEDKLSSAIEEFTKAKALFLQAGNFLESMAISQHFIAYCLYNTDRRNEAIELFDQVESFCKKNNYKWLQLSNFYWLTGWSSEFLDFHSTRKAKEKYEIGLKVSEEINDLYLTQKYLLTLASRSHRFRKEQEMLFYLQKLLKISNSSKISFRQKFRNFTTSINMLVSANFDELAKAVAMEEVSLAKELKGKFFITASQIDVGVVQMQSNNFPEAEKWLFEAKQTAEDLDEESQKNDLLADILLKFGHLARKKDNYQEAANFYNESLKIVKTQKAPLLLYEVSKSLLLTYQELDSDKEVENQLPAVIKIAEDYRSEILEEQERNSFFDNEQTVYDVAVEQGLRAGDDRKAFNYAEISNSRSLLDWLNKGISKSAEKSEILLKESTTPYTIDEIQNRMPSEVQILQYTILEKKVLLWVVSKENITVIPSEIPSQQLNENVKKYLSLIQSRDDEKQLQAARMGRELYDILITPILPHLDKNKEICLIPNKILFQLPFSTLVSPDGNFFLVEFSFFYSPSANVFILSTENALKKEKLVDEHLLSIGNPAFDRKEFPDLQDLPVSVNEAGAISQYYEKAKILPGKEATKKAVQKLYRDFEIIHFAGHYVVQHSSPLYSGLVLAKDDDNGVLTNYELAGDDLLKTKLVVLSACQTGVEGYYASEGLIGLSRTFLASGVPLVIASQWKVDSDAAAQLMKNFHRYRRQEKLSASNALRQAQIDMLRNEKDGFSSPYYWAAFASFGGYTRY